METTLVTKVQTVQTPLDHMSANVTLDILEMDIIAQVNLIYFFKHWKGSTHTA